MTTECTTVMTTNTGYQIELDAKFPSSGGSLSLFHSLEFTHLGARFSTNA